MMQARIAVLVALPLALGGCGFWPASQDQPFTVTGEIPPNPAPKLGFHTADRRIDGAHAGAICADGYEVLDKRTLPADDDKRDNEAYYQARVHCTTSFLSLF